MKRIVQSLRSRQLRRFGFDRDDVFAQVVNRLATGVAPSRRSSLWIDAVYGWGNEEWSADELCLAEVVRAAEVATGSILDCGSGLTTVLMGVVAARRGVQLHSLEHDAQWHARVARALRDSGATTTTLHLAPLVDYGDYAWYDAPLSAMPRDFSLVICDGPPQSTRGGRSGMMPTMRSRLAAGCVVVMDDANRPAERELVRRWSRDSVEAPVVSDEHRGFARIVLPGQHPLDELRSAPH